MKTIVSTLAAALIASASFAGAAFAGGGSYYEGIWPDQDHKVESTHRAPSGSYDHTGSIYSTHQQANQFAAAPAKTIGSGDYYQGVNRPN